MPSDDALWSRSRGGDAEAFGLLFERHAKEIYNYCFSRVGERAAAEDLLSIVFLEAWRHRDRELRAGKVLPWLFGIATNVVRNRRRAERRFAAALARVPRPQPEPSFADQSVERLDRERDLSRAMTFIARLPRRELEVFVLSAWFELGYEDAAYALDIPVGTVRSRLARARKRLLSLDRPYGLEDNEPMTVEAIEP